MSDAAMSEAGGAAVGELAPAAPPATSAGRLGARDLRFAAFVVAVLGLLGALLGLVWAAWSPPRPHAVALAPGVFFPLDESETFIAADGRFLVLGVAAGLVGGIAVWFAVARRGPSTALALVFGSLAGSALMELVGHLTGGGSFTANRHHVIAELPLSLHAQGLLLVQPALAALVYSVLVAFTASDDLGHPDPVRAALARRSIPPDRDPYDGGGDGDAAGAAQERDLPPQ